MRSGKRLQHSSPSHTRHAARKRSASGRTCDTHTSARSFRPRHSQHAASRRSPGTRVRSTRSPARKRHARGTW
eukprot:10736518-Alexandrium_andersonii.AAC.1